MSFFCPIAGSIESLVVKFADGGPKKRQQSQQNHGITISTYLLIPNNIILKGDVSIGKLLANLYWAWGMMSSFWFSIQMKFLIWYEISFWYQCKLKQTFFQFENPKSCSLVQVAHAYLIWHENHVSKNSLSWAGQFYHVNAVRTLLWNKTHSGMKVSQVSHKQPLEANFDTCFSSLTCRC